MDHGLSVSPAQEEKGSTDHSSESDETDQSIWGQQAQAYDQSLSQSLQFIFIDTGVDHVEEDGWDLGRSRKGIFDSGVLGQQLGGQVGSRDILVVRREGVSLKTEWTDPKLSTDVNLTTGYQRDCVQGGMRCDVPIRVQNSFTARLTGHRLVHDRW